MNKNCKKVLIIDDDFDFRSSLSEILESQGYAVVLAASGKEGLQKVISEKPNLIVLDIMMENEWMGYEVNQKIKFRDEFEAVKHIPILMVSSIQRDPFSMFYHATEVGMVTPDGYLTKPLDIPRFLDKVSKLTGGSKASGSS